MKNLLYLLFIPLGLLSCKKKNHEPEPQVPSVVQGKLYGVPFEAKVAIEKYTSFSMGNYKPEDLVCVYISSDASRSCSNTLKEFSMRLTAPKKPGTYSQNDVYILTNDPRDPTGVSGGLFSSESTIITITSVTQDKVIGVVDVKSAEDNTEFKGRFEASICR
jgi:hypothetical protein